MNLVKMAAAVAWLGLLAGCAREPHYGNYGTRPTQWSLPGPDYEDKVFGPMPFEEVRDFVREKEESGWMVIGYELASEPEGIMVNQIELDRPAKPKRAWTFDIPKTPDSVFNPPAKATIPPYVGDDVRTHRQKYLVMLRRWL